MGSAEAIGAEEAGEPMQSGLESVGSAFAGEPMQSGLESAGSAFTGESMQSGLESAGSTFAGEPMQSGLKKICYLHTSRRATVCVDRMRKISHWFSQIIHTIMQ
jgi:hypothetical protein